MSIIHQQPEYSDTSEKVPIVDYDPDSIEEAMRFLENCFKANADAYMGSFAMQLNNESAIELAEFLFSSEITRRALSVIQENKPSDRSIFELY